MTNAHMTNAYSTIITFLARCKSILTSRGLSLTSRKLYLVDIKKFLEYAFPDGIILASRLTQPAVYHQYLESLHTQGSSPSTTARSLAALRQLGSLIASEYSSPDPTTSLSLQGTVITESPISHLQNYIKFFTKYLNVSHLSSQTIKSYKSDITQYLTWITNISVSKQMDRLLTEKNLTKYADHLANSQLATQSTIDRKIAAINRFCAWYKSSYPTYAKSDSKERISYVDYPTYHPEEASNNLLPQVASVKNEKKLSLWSRLKHSTVIPTLNLSSIISFVVLLTLLTGLAYFGYRQLSRDQVLLTQAYPSTPVTPNRQLSFQGRLESSGGTPITSATNLVFKLWDASSSGNQLYTSGTCSITPDSDGVFSTQIGATCGSAIASTVFTENANVYLEVIVGAETLTPRQQIATVAYALNSETLQGFPIAATVSAIRNTVVPMNQWGEILIGEQSPRLKGVSGTFQISAPALSLITATGTNGNISFAPDGTGQINSTGNTTTTNFFNLSNAQLTTGSLITGTVANNNSGFKFLDFLGGSSPTSKFSVGADGTVTTAGNIGFSNANSYIGYPGSTAQAYIPYDSSLNGILNSTTNLYMNIDSDNNDSDSRAFIVGKNRSASSGGTDIFKVNENGDVYISDGLSLYENAVSDGTVEATKFCTGDGETNCVTDFSAISGGATIWTDSGTTAYLTATTDELVLGGTSPLSSAKFSIDGDSDQIQQIIQGYSGQTANLQEWQNSSGAVLGSISNLGKLSITQNNTNTTAYQGESFTFTSSPSTNAAVEMQNLEVATTKGGANDLNTLTGIASSVYNAGSGDLGMARGFWFLGGALSTGDIGNLIVTDLQTYGSGSGLVTTSTGLRIQDMGVASTVASSIVKGIDILDSPSTVTAYKYGINIGSQSGAYEGWGLRIADQSGNTANSYAIETNAGLVTLNQGGDASSDLRVEGDTDANLLFTDASADKVGIGTASPATKLHVVGGTSAGLNETLRISGGAAAGESGPSIGFHQRYGTDVYPTWKVGEIGSVFETGGNYHGALTFLTNSGATATDLSEKMRITGSGNVGIGTTNPGSTRLAVMGGNVGLGTTSTGARLDVVSTATNTYGLIVRGGSTVGTAAAESGQLQLGASSLYHGNLSYGYNEGALYIDNSWNDDTGNIYLRTKTTGTPVNAITILGSGAVGIGTTGPDAKTDILATSGQQLRLTYTDGSVYSGFTLDSSGNLTIDNTGTKTIVADDLQITGDDLYMTTNTAGYLLIADGTNYNPTAVSGDVTINGSGVTTIGADKITESMLKSVNTPTDEYCLSYESTVGDFEWQTCGSGGSSDWRYNLGTLSPVNDTVDLLVGGNATASAKFAVLNVNSGTPTASVSGGLNGNAAYLTSSGTLATARKQSLTVGDSNTGNVIIAPGGTTALTGIGANLTAAGNLTIAGTTGLTFSGSGGDITFTNAEKIDNDTDGTLNLSSTILKMTGGTTLVSDQASVDLFNTTTTSLSIGGASTALNLGAGGSLTRTIAIGTGTGADTINIGTGITTADDINIGGLATSHTDFTGILNFAGGTTYYVDASGNLNSNAGTFAGTLTANGDFVANGTNITLGNAITDSIDFQARVLQDADLIPITATGTNDLGSSSLPWDNLYTIGLSFPSAGTISIPDNTASAFKIAEGANTYLDITTTNNVETFSLNLPVGGATSHTANLFTANIAQTINLGTGTTADVINIGTGGTTADDINIGGLATSHTDFTGILNFAGGTTYYVDASGNAKFLDLIAADTANPGLTVGNGSIGYALIGGSTISDNASDLTLDSDTTKTVIADDLQINGNDILDSAAGTRITLGATTTLTNTTTTLSGTTTLTASSLATLDMAATVGWDVATLNATSLATFDTADTLSLAATTITLNSNSTINGGSSANDDLTLQGTSNGTRTTSYVLLQPNGGNVGIGNSAPTVALDVTGSATVSGNITLGGQLQLGRFTNTPTAVGAGSVVFDVNSPTAAGGLYFYGSDAAWHGLTTGLTKFTANNASVSNGSYVEIAHNQATNDLTLTGWVKDTISGLYKNITEYSHNLVHNLQNQWSDASYTAFDIDTSGTLRDNLYGYWKMDETSATAGTQVTRVDSYSSNHLTDNRSATSYIFSGTGKVNNGADLELSNGNFFEKADNDQLSTGNIDFTVSAWVKLESETAGTTPEVIVSKSDAAGTGEYMLYYTGATADDFAFVLYNSSGTAICTATNNINESVGTWYHLVAIHDAVNNGCSLTVNNGTAATGTETASNDVSDTTANFRIGARYSTEQDYFDGVIDEVGFWKKVLSSTEITDLYNSGNGNSYGGHTGFVRTQADLTDVSLTPAVNVGTGADGAITISSSSTNINTTAIATGRTCADAVNYSVISLTSTTATLESGSSPATNNCIVTGDEILLINLRGTTSAFGNVGNYETLRVSGVNGDVITFATSKTKYYGDGTTDDTNLGLASSNQTVMLQRVPNYTSVSFSGTGVGLVPDDWVPPNDSSSPTGEGEGGVLFFRANGTVNVSTNNYIASSYKGYLGAPAPAVNGADAGDGAESICGPGGLGQTGAGAGGNGAAGGGGAGTGGVGGNGSCGGGGGGGNTGTAAGGTGSAGSGGSGGGGGYSNASGGGGGYGTAATGGGGGNNGANGGTNSSGNGGTATVNGGGGGGGGTYGDSGLTKLYFGSGGGAGGVSSAATGGAGGDGGGIIYIAATNISISGQIASLGNNGGDGTGTTRGAGGGGAGGSIRLEGSTLTLGTSLVSANGSPGGSGSTYSGGTGGSGRIAIYYASSLSGTTTPTLSSTFTGYNTYGVYNSPAIQTPNAVTLESLRWEIPTSTPSGLKKVEFQTRTGNSANPTDGTWEDWRPEANQKASGCASPNCVSLSDGNTHTEWTGTNVTVADGDVTRNVDMFEDEDEATAGNLTKMTSSTNGGTAEDTISSTDFSSYDYVTFWVRASQTGSTLKFGFGESAATEQEELVLIDTADVWQKVYWDLSDIPSGSRNAVTKLRFTNLIASSNTFYIDNVQLEKHMVTPSGSAITSTPNNYFQYRIIFTTTNNAYFPSVENIQLVYTDGFKIVQTDTNTVRLYNYSGSTQDLRLDAITFGADLAEWYTVDSSEIGPGDLVALSGRTDDYGVPILRKTNSSNDPQLLGAISTKAGQTLGLEAENRRLLALAGRIPVKMDESSDPIKTGDPLTSSTISGLARRAHPGELSFARATTDWSPGDSAQLLVIVNNTVPTSGIQLVDAMIRQIDGVWTAVIDTADTVATNVTAFAKVVATRIESASVATALISPLDPSSPITIEGPVVITNLPGNTTPALVVDGQISSATISARVAELQEVHADKIVANEIVADKITAGSIEGLDARIASLSAGTNINLSDSDVDTITERIRNRIASVSDSSANAQDLPIPEVAIAKPEELLTLDSTPSATLASNDIDFLTVNDYLAVIGHATITSLTVNDTLAVNQIQSSNDLALQPVGGTIRLASNTMVITSTGEVAINGNLTVSGNLMAQAADVNSLSLGSPNSSTSPLGQLLSVYNEQGQTVATIDASGSANLASLKTQIITIAAGTSATGSADLAVATSSNATAGQAILHTPATELVISSPYVTADSLVYLTPTANTDNKVLFVKAKNTCTNTSSSCSPSFTVGIDGPANTDISFNWWIIELKP